MADKSTPDNAEQQQQQPDDLSRLQSKLEGLGVLFYECVGVIQRDAPPTSRSPDEADQIAADNKARALLASKTPQFAQDIVRANREIDALLAEMQSKAAVNNGNERQLLDTANFESVQAGDDMTEAVDDASKLLTSVRNLIAARESES